MKPKRLSVQEQRNIRRRIRRLKHPYSLGEKLADEIYNKGWRDGANQSRDYMMSKLETNLPLVLPSFLQLALAQAGLEIVPIGPFPRDENKPIH